MAVVKVAVRHAGRLATASHVAAERRPPLEEDPLRVGTLRQHHLAQQAHVRLVELGVGLPVLGRLAQPALDPVRRRPAVAATELAHVMLTAAPCSLGRGRRRLQALELASQLCNGLSAILAIVGFASYVAIPVALAVLLQQTIE